MLAAITFPCPPTGYRPSSTNRTIDSVTSCSPHLKIQPPTWSKRAPTSNGVPTPTASFDQLSMKSHVSEGFATTVVAILSAVVTTNTPAEIESTMSQQPSDSSTYPNRARYSSTTSTPSDDPNSIRLCLRNNMTTRASSSLMPPTTNKSYDLISRSPGTTCNLTILLRERRSWTPGSRSMIISCTRHQVSIRPSTIISYESSE
ncbi:hypothetical protein GGR53DRAFT_128744 [Hypoxylon sp. FL1150]|nr:hypothetical protein GGR53DRAFT_128744 [Hypoxylon sp. FL1150]